MGFGINNKDNVYSCLVEYMKQNMYSPSVRDLQELTGIKSISTIWSLLRELQEDGLITIGDSGVRCIKLNKYMLVPIEDL